jgi:peptidoglycan/xylan/chitin deacetylase (PgdA/CDA1 family)
MALVISGVVKGGGDAGSALNRRTPAVLGDTTTPQPTPSATGTAGGATQAPTASEPPGSPITSAIDVPIMMYHIIGPPDRPGNAGLATSTEDFAAQMSYMACAGYTPITMQRLFDAFDGKAALPEKPIILTFDDGWDGQYANAFPILQQHAFVGSFAIVTGYVEAGGPFMTWAQIKEMSDAGNEMMSHTVSHIDLGTTDDATVVDQLTTSKATLEERTGKPVSYFVYPAGEPFINGSAERQSQVMQMLRDTGYRGALLDGSGYGNLDPNAPYQLNRVRVSADESLATFAASIYGPAPGDVSCG